MVKTKGKLSLAHTIDQALNYQWLILYLTISLKHQLLALEKLWKSFYAFFHPLYLRGERKGYNSLKCWRCSPRPRFTMKCWSIATAQNPPLALPCSGHSGSAFPLLSSPTATESALASHCGWPEHLFKKTKWDTLLFILSPHQQQPSMKNKAKRGKAYILVTWVIYSPEER